MNFRVLSAVTLLAVTAFLPRAAAYTLYGPKWTTAVVTMHLQLGAGSGVLSDGFPSWGASAEDALFVWNSHIGASNFSVVRDSTVARTSGNRLNNVFFSDDVNGQAWGTGVVAVTLIHSLGSSQTETDVIFNNRLSWNSYRGPLRTASSGGTLHDFHRVALHEFGHALGLDHPDEAGQSVSAIMNSHVSGLDALTSDDIAGGQA
ncbi:MAG: matrixin family metalloprotease, partial [Opitutaceae bacterium]